MPKKHNTNIYQTTAFDQYPPKQRQELLERRKQIIDLRLRSQSHFNYPETADFLWKQSEIATTNLQQWIKNNPAPRLIVKHQPNLIRKTKRWLYNLFEHQYA